MSEDATASLVKWSVIGIGAYLVYKALTGTSNAVGNAVNSATQGIANAIVGKSTVTPQGSVVMPDGTAFPASQLTNMQFGFEPGTNDATFLGNDGNTYQLSPQVNGSYTATPY